METVKPYHFNATDLDLMDRSMVKPGKLAFIMQINSLTALMFYCGNFKDKTPPMGRRRIVTTKRPRIKMTPMVIKSSNSSLACQLYYHSIKLFRFVVKL